MTPGAKAPSKGRHRVSGGRIARGVAGAIDGVKRSASAVTKGASNGGAKNGAKGVAKNGAKSGAARPSAHGWTPASRLAAAPS